MRSILLLPLVAIATRGNNIQYICMYMEHVCCVAAVVKDSVCLALEC